uniref:ENR1 protein n=1 Tax=Laticauda laticaudata TaxID=8630 RepID=A0A8C5S3I7_LATLA
MWAAGSRYGYRTPIYMLNRIIRLQAVVELTANKTAQSLHTLAIQQKKFRDAIYQNRLALDYLLATKGGVCAKFNFTNCYLESDDVGEIIEHARHIENLAHVPVQKWNGFDFGEIFGSWFPKLPGLQAIVALIGMVAAGCVILPCILPIFVRTISSSLSILVEKKAMATQTCQPLIKENLETHEKKSGDSIKNSEIHGHVNN